MAKYGLKWQEMGAGIKAKTFESDKARANFIGKISADGRCYRILEVSNPIITIKTRED